MKQFSKNYDFLTKLCAISAICTCFVLLAPNLLAFPANYELFDYNGIYKCNIPAHDGLPEKTLQLNIFDLHKSQDEIKDLFTWQLKTITHAAEGDTTTFKAGDGFFSNQSNGTSLNDYYGPGVPAQGMQNAGSDLCYHLYHNDPSETDVQSFTKESNFYLKFKDNCNIVSVTASRGNPSESEINVIMMKSPLDSIDPVIQVIPPKAKTTYIEYPGTAQRWDQYNVGLLYTKYCNDPSTSTALNDAKNIANADAKVTYFGWDTGHLRKWSFYGGTPSYGGLGIHRGAFYTKSPATGGSIHIHNPDVPSKTALIYVQKIGEDININSSIINSSDIVISSSIKSEIIRSNAADTTIHFPEHSAYSNYNVTVVFMDYVIYDKYVPEADKFIKDAKIHTTMSIPINSKTLVNGMPIQKARVNVCIFGTTPITHELVDGSLKLISNSKDTIWFKCRMGENINIVSVIFDDIIDGTSVPIKRGENFTIPDPIGNYTFFAVTPKNATQLARLLPALGKEI